MNIHRSRIINLPGKGSLLKKIVAKKHRRAKEQAYSRPVFNGVADALSIPVALSDNRVLPRNGEAFS